MRSQADVELTRAFDRLSARLDLTDQRLAHIETLLETRLNMLERSQQDQETRLRAASDSVVRLSTLSSLAQAAQAAFTVALSAAAAWLGQR
jgi:hypothetical protein